MVKSWLKHYQIPQKAIDELNHSDKWNAYAETIAKSWNNPESVFNIFSKLFGVDVSPQTEADKKIQHSLESNFNKRLIDKQAVDYVYNRLSDLARNWDEITYYYPGTAIIQTSGAGKSRSVVSLAENYGVYVIYCSFMEGNGFPKKSDIAKFIQHGDEDTYAKYFIACLATLAEMKDSFTPDDIVKLCCGQELASREKKKISFWNKAIAKMNLLGSRTFQILILHDR